MKNILPIGYRINIKSTNFAQFLQLYNNDISTKGKLVKRNHVFRTTLSRPT